jgi:outer membrane protein
MLRTIRFTALVLAGVAGYASAADLLTVYRQARGYDATFAAAQATRNAGAEKTGQAQALLLPSVALSGKLTGSSTHYDAGGQAAANKTSNGVGVQYGLSASYPLYRKELDAAAEQLRLQAALAELQYTDAETDLAVRVAQAYFDVLLAEDTLQFVQAQKQATTQQLAEARKRFQVGVATITDTHEAQSSFDAIVAREIAAENDLAVKRFAFQQVTGQEPAQLAGLNTAITLPGEDRPLAEWLATTEQNSSRLQQLQQALAIAEAEIDKYRRRADPTLDAFASITQGYDSSGISRSTGVDGTRTLAVGLQFNMPLYSGGGRDAKYREAIALRDQARQQLEAARRKLAQDVRQYYLGVSSGAAVVKAQEQAVRSTQSQLDSTTLGKEVGVRTSLDVLNAQQKLYANKRDLAEARYAYLISRLRLYAVAGALTEREVAAVNGFLKN